MAKRNTNHVGKDSPGNAPAKFRRTGSNTNHRAGWNEARPQLLKDLIASTAIVGAAIRFGTSRDGGAYAIGLYVNGEVTTEWLPCNEDINQLLEELIDYFVSLDAEQERKDSKTVVD